MTELGEQFILALIEQGFAISFTPDDMVVSAPQGLLVAYVPRVLLEDSQLDLLLAIVIERFVEDLGLRWQLDDGKGRPGLN